MRWLGLLLIVPLTACGDLPTSPSTAHSVVCPTGCHLPLGCTVEAGRSGYLLICPGVSPVLIDVPPDAPVVDLR